MLLLNTCRRALRRTALASALGAGFLAPHVLSNSLLAQQPAAYQPRLLPSQQQAKPLEQSTPTLLPPAPQSVSNGNTRLDYNVMQSGSVEAGSTVRAAQQQPNQNQYQMQQAQYVDPVQKPSLFSRLFRGFRKDSSPSGPPQDPGMTYPRRGAAQPQETARQSQSPASDGNEILIPPDWNRGVAESSPAMLIPPPAGGSGAAEQLIQPPAYSGSVASELSGQRTASLEPGGNFLVPPAVDGSVLNNVPPAVAETPAPVEGQDSGKSTLTLTPAPKAPPKVEGISPSEAPKATATSSRPELPVFSLNSPATASEAEPEENMDLLLLPAPVGTAPSAIATPEPLAPATDPLAGTFSEEPKAAPAVEKAPMADKAVPYTGLSLDEDMFVAPIPKAEEKPNFQAPLPAPAPPAEEPLNIIEESNPMLPPVPVTEATTQSPKAPMAPKPPEAPGAAAAVSEPAPLPGLAIAAKTAAIEAPQVESPKVEAPQLEAPTPEASQPSVAKEAMPAPPDVAEAKKPAPSDQHKSKLELIQSRQGSGLKGFCAVALQDDRELKETHEEFSALFHGRLYSFSSEPALETFLADPARYAPAARGSDVIHTALTGEEVEGSLDHAVWYQGRLYLFTTVETLETFTAAPSSHATAE